MTHDCSCSFVLPLTLSLSLSVSLSLSLSATSDQDFASLPLPAAMWARVLLLLSLLSCMTASLKKQTDPPTLHDMSEFDMDEVHRLMDDYIRDQANQLHSQVAPAATSTMISASSSTASNSCPLSSSFLQELGEMYVLSRNALLDQMVAGLDLAEMARSLKNQLLGEGMLQPAISVAARRLMESILHQPFRVGSRTGCLSRGHRRRADRDQRGLPIWRRHHIRSCQPSATQPVSGRDSPDQPDTWIAS